MRRGVLIALLLGVAAALPWTTAAAEPLVSMQSAADGTLVVIGSGWRPGQRLVVTAGAAVFPARADGVGDFEIRTGLPASGKRPGPLAVKRASPAPLRFAALTSATPDRTDGPLAVLYAQSLVQGTALLVLASVALGALRLGLSRLRPRAPR